MESVVLSPSAGQTVVATEESNRHGHHSPEWFRSESRETQREILAAVSSSATASAVGFKDNLVTAYQIEGRSGVQAVKIAGDASVQAEKLAAASTLQAATLASAAILDSTKNAAAIAAQLAECCCELREKIGADGDMTRALINANALQDQRDRAAKAENALQAFYTRNVPPVTP